MESMNLPSGQNPQPTPRHVRKCPKMSDPAELSQPGAQLRLRCCTHLMPPVGGRAEYCVTRYGRGARGGLCEVEADETNPIEPNQNQRKNASAAQKAANVPSAGNSPVTKRTHRSAVSKSPTTDRAGTIGSFDTAARRSGKCGACHCRSHPGRARSRPCDEIEFATGGAQPRH